MHEQPEEVVWEPTGLADNIIVALSAVNQFFILITVLHLSWTFKWPPCECFLCALILQQVVHSSVRARWYDGTGTVFLGPFRPLCLFVLAHLKRTALAR